MMDQEVTNRLAETAHSLSLNTNVNKSDVQEVFTFNVREMDIIPSNILTQYAVMLGQYLVTLQVRFNTARVMASQKRKVLERRVQKLIQDGKADGKTLKEREANAIAGSEELQSLEREYDIDAAERDLLEGIDKPVIELINAIKSELRRRTEERHYADKEKVGQ